MKVLVIGSGAREHALVWKMKQSPLVTKIFAAPGNAGIAALAECVSIKAEDVQGLLDFAVRESIGLTVVGPEVPLTLGIQNLFESKGLKVFGPSKEAALLEGSKVFSKQMMTKFGIPTAEYEVFSNVKEAKHYVIETEMPVVIKADGLAAGKGVVICETAEQAVTALTQIMEQKIFGDAGNKVIIEEKLEGEEISVFALTDGEIILPLVSARDHKRAYDNDQGANTGGMGAFSPNPQFSDAEIQDMVKIAIEPLVRGMKKEGKPFRGVVFAGIMMTTKGPYVLEYNARFGDPETEVILPRLKSDIVPLFMQIAEGKLQQTQLEWDNRPCMTVVMVSGGYPSSYAKGHVIAGLEAASARKDVFVFHAGTEFNASKQVVSAGGRVLAVTAWGDSMRQAFERAYQAVSDISFKDCYYRRDIGKKTVEVLR